MTQPKLEAMQFHPDARWIIERVEKGGWALSFARPDGTVDEPLLRDPSSIPLAGVAKVLNQMHEALVWAQSVEKAMHSATETCRENRVAGRGLCGACSDCVMHWKKEYEQLCEQVHKGGGRWSHIYEDQYCIICGHDGPVEEARLCEPEQRFKELRDAHFGTNSLNPGAVGYAHLWEQKAKELEAQNAELEKKLATLATSDAFIAKLQRSLSKALDYSEVLRHGLDEIAGTFMPDPLEPQDADAAKARATLDKANDVLGGSVELQRRPADVLEQAARLAKMHLHGISLPELPRHVARRFGAAWKVLSDTLDSLDAPEKKS